MKTKIFTIYDLKANCYLPILQFRSTGEALRAFESSCKDVNHQFNKYASDFTLFEIGEYDDESASIFMYEVKRSLGTALEYKAKDEPM